MKDRWKYVALMGVLLLAFSCSTPLDRDFDENPYIDRVDIEMPTGKTLTVAVARPEVFHPDSTYPVLIAFPPGAQGYNMVEWMMETYFITASIQHNWVVVSPSAVDGNSFHNGSQNYLIYLYNYLNENFNVEGGKFHLAGVSSGGMSAFFVAANDTGRCHSLTVLPGYPPDATTINKLNRFTHIPVTMFVGANDEDFHDPMVSTRDQLLALGSPVFLTVLPSEGHVLETLNAAEIMAVLELIRRGEY